MMIVKNKTYIKPELELKALILEGMIATTPQGEGSDQETDQSGGGNTVGNPAKESGVIDWSDL